MSEISASEVAKNGLWTNNPALVQLLGLCPLLAVTGTVVNALGLGIATLAVLIGSNTIVSLIRNHVSDAVRLPVFVIIIAAFVTCAELLMKAYMNGWMKDSLHGLSLNVWRFFLAFHLKEKMQSLCKVASIAGLTRAI